LAINNVIRRRLILKTAVGDEHSGISTDYAAFAGANKFGIYEPIN